MVAKLPKGQKLIAGHFYRSYDHEIWCCYKVELSFAYCVRPNDNMMARFFLDGRSDTIADTSSLIEDMTVFWDSLRPNSNDEPKPKLSDNHKLRRIQGLLGDAFSGVPQWSTADRYMLAITDIINEKLATPPSYRIDWMGQEYVARIVSNDPPEVTGHSRHPGSAFAALLRKLMEQGVDPDPGPLEDEVHIPCPDGTPNDG